MVSALSSAKVLRKESVVLIPSMNKDLEILDLGLQEGIEVILGEFIVARDDHFTTFRVDDVVSHYLSQQFLESDLDIVNRCFGQSLGK